MIVAVGEITQLQAAARAGHRLLASASGAASL